MAPPPPKHHENRIVVPVRMVNGGLDIKYESDPYGIQLYGLLSCNEYQDAITRVNETLKPSRSKTVDTALLITGPLLVPLALWGARHLYLTKKRKRLLKRAIQEFNAQYPELLMRYNHRPESCLTIERRTEGVAPPLPEEQRPEQAGLASDLVGEEGPVRQQQHSFLREYSSDETVPFVRGVHSRDEELPQIS